MLLRSNNGSWTTYSQPCNNFCCSKFVVFHHVGTYKRSCSSQASCKWIISIHISCTCNTTPINYANKTQIHLARVHVVTFAMYGYSTLCIFTYFKEALQYTVCWHTTINKEQIVVVKACVRKSTRIINLLIETNNRRHVVFPEVREVGLGCVQRIACNKVLCRVISSIFLNASSAYFLGFLVIFNRRNYFKRLLLLCS